MVKLGTLKGQYDHALLALGSEVPDRSPVQGKLELIGVRLFPPAAAHADVTFWLSAPQEESVKVTAGTQVATPRTQSEPAIVFETSDDLEIVPCSHVHTLSSVAAGTYRRHDDQRIR